ncbi:hypothetical protein [Streptomyces sp. NBC_01304]|uniref:hypothetical protein n=1 Tax=Streptomyces sp. NBC_01304 TaxID=2903818 RepID=UPI002E12FE0D|nr:hypothetical protein OG430_15730 [Streptomyces sp. NBC_01304]
MLALRLARGAHPLVLLRRLSVAAASAGTGFLLLCTLGYAVAHPAASSSSALRLAWCLPPLAATVQLAVAVARTDPATRPRAGLSAVGLGPGRMRVIAAVSTGVSCLLGSMVALLFFLHLRGDLSGLPFDGAAGELLGAGQSLPLGAALTLLAVVPLVAAGASAFTPRAKQLRPGDEQDPAAPEAPAPAPNGLPWGVALMAAGLALETYAARGAGTGGIALPGRVAATPAGVLGGWAACALGLTLAGPGLAFLSGRLLQCLRPGAARLLGGRALMEEARRIGRPLGVVCAVASGALAAGSLYAGRRPEVGPLTELGAGLVVGCTLLALLAAAIEARQARAHTTAALLRLGAPVSLLRGAAGLRAVALLLVFGPLTWAVAELVAIPLRP